jgi:hypothetical protein
MKFAVLMQLQLTVSFHMGSARQRPVIEGSVEWRRPEYGKISRSYVSRNRMACYKRFHTRSCLSIPPRQSHHSQICGSVGLSFHHPSRSRRLPFQPDHNSIARRLAPHTLHKDLRDIDARRNALHKA